MSSHLLPTMFKGRPLSYLRTSLVTNNTKASHHTQFSLCVSSAYTNYTFETIIQRRNMSIEKTVKTKLEHEKDLFKLRRDMTKYYTAGNYNDALKVDIHAYSTSCTLP